MGELGIADLPGRPHYQCASVQKRPGYVGAQSALGPGDHYNPIRRFAHVRPVQVLLFGGSGGFGAIAGKEEGKSRLGGEHASGVVTAQWDYQHLVLGAVFLVYVAGECLAAREARGALGHGRTRRIESTEREDVEFAEQVGYGTRGQLLFQLVVGELGGVAGAALEAVGPVIVRGAVPSVAERLNAAIVGIGSVGGGALGLAAAGWRRGRRSSTGWTPRR